VVKSKVDESIVLSAPTAAAANGMAR